MGALIALIAAALIIGISKTSIGGFGVIAVALFALAMPAKESTAAVLLLLLVGDVVAVTRFRQHADWTLLKQLLPYVIPGLVLGTLFLRVVDDTWLRRSIGALLCVMAVIQIVQRVRERRAGLPPEIAGASPHKLISAAAGTAAGFTTMTANAAGPVMTLYLLAARVDKHAFIGTGAWYYFIVNLTKVPFSAALHLFPASTLRLDLMLAPVVLLGTWIGTHVTRLLPQRAFDRLAILSSVIAGVALVVR